MKKILLILVPAVLVAIGGFFALNSFFSKNIVIKNAVSIIPEAKQKVSVYAVGDIMMDRGVEYMIDRYGNKDYKFSFEKIAGYVSKSDILFGNLEGQISDKGNKIGTVNSFRVEPEAIEGLKLAGFDILSVANNHSFDYNVAALTDSFKRLKDAGIEYVGGGMDKKEAFQLKIIEKNGARIGFLGYCSVGAKGWMATDASPGIAFMNENEIEEMKQQISKAKEQVDILMVSNHFGDEYQTTENKAQEKMYSAFIDAGADVVLGHHPHVMQPVVQYKNGWIAYSLGNFLFDMAFSKETMEGMLLEIQIEGKKIKRVSAKEIKMNSHYQPEVVRD